MPWKGKKAPKTLGGKVTGCSNFVEKLCMYCIILLDVILFVVHKGCFTYRKIPKISDTRKFIVNL